MPIEILSFNHYNAIHDAFKNASNNIRIISPFIKPNAAKLLANTADRLPQGTCILITRFAREDFINAVSSLNALSELAEAGVRIIAVKRLHTKLYLFDDTIAIVGSANFTHGGLVGNLELSLMLKDESETVEQLCGYFDDLLEQACNCTEYEVDITRIEKEKELVRKCLNERNKTSVKNETQYGADIKDPPIEELPIDPIEQILSEVDTDAKAVLKFEGRAHSRYPADGIYEPNYHELGGFYFTSSPFFPASLTADKQIFMAALSWDNAGRATPLIVGRAKTEGSDRQNIADEQMMDNLPWTADFPYYIKTYDFEIINEPIKNCISLLDLLSEIGADLYPSTAGTNTPANKLKTWHHRKSYIHITPQAAQRINQMLDVRFAANPPRRY